MKITRIKSYEVASHDRVGGFKNSGYFIVKVETDVGIHGLGEAGIRFWGESIAKAVEHLSELVIGQDPFSTERLWQHMFRGFFFPASGVYACAISAIDIALWDIKGKALGLPVYKLLGGPVRDMVVCYPHLDWNIGESAATLVESCLKTVDEGWKFVRWGMPMSDPEGRLEPVESIRIAQEQMALVREAVGSDIQICFDVHTRLDTTHVISLCRDLEPYRPFFIEDPIRSENTGSYRTLARHIRLPLAAGEQWPSRWSFREVVEEELISYARIDVCNVGGLTEAVKIANWCETHYIDIAPHNPLGPVSAAACVALCMASTNVGVQEMPRRPGSIDTDLFPDQIDWRDGYAFAPDRPGLGVEMDEDLAAARPMKSGGRPPMLHRNDGAFTNF